jgi:hypothetical protein
MSACDNPLEQEGNVRTVKLALLLSLTACGLAGKIDARYRYENSVAVYTGCVNGWTAAVDRDKRAGVCEQERQVMEANRRNLGSQ